MKRRRGGGEGEGETEPHDFIARRVNRLSSKLRFSPRPSNRESFVIGYRMTDFRSGIYSFVYLAIRNAKCVFSREIIE